MGFGLANGSLNQSTTNGHLWWEVFFSWGVVLLQKARKVEMSSKCFKTHFFFGTSNCLTLFLPNQPNKNQPSSPAVAASPRAKFPKRDQPVTGFGTLFGSEVKESWNHEIHLKYQKIKKMNILKKKKHIYEPHHVVACKWMLTLPEFYLWTGW